MSRDERLARRAAGGDRRAFAEIYERYHQDLYRFCLAMIGDPADAQDALQNTMVKVLRALPGEKREIRLKPWLYRIARNESVETLRRRRESVELGPELSSDTRVADRAETRERLRTLLADLDQLPERQRAALVMRELSGLDFAQIAAAFGTSPAVARQTLYEARLSLRRLEQGREMSCAEVMKALSDADGRVTRRRDIRAHLRSCPGCRAFGEEIAGRRENLAAIAPLPVAASAGLLHSVLGGKVGGGVVSGGLGGPLGAGAGKAVATSAIVKSAVTVTVVAAVGAGAADRAHLIQLPLDGRSGGSATLKSDTPGAAGGTVRGGNGEAAAGGKATGKVRDRASGGDGGERAGWQSASAAGHASGNAPAASRSEGGEKPPGGGFGRSASRRHGRPESTPAAAEHGQQTSASHKSSHLAPPAAKGSHGAPPAGAGGAPPHSQAPAAPKPPPAAPARPPAPPDPESAAPPASAPPEHPSGKGEETAAGAENGS